MINHLEVAKEKLQITEDKIDDLISNHIRYVDSLNMKYEILNEAVNKFTGGDLDGGGVFVVEYNKLDGYEKKEKSNYEVNMSVLREEKFRVLEEIRYLTSKETK